jgi:hypothetical protein
MEVEHLTTLMLYAEQNHGQYEPTAPKHHWSTWYAAYIVARDEGKSEDDAFEAATRHTEGSS